jgi:hypothetical protein
MEVWGSDQDDTKDFLNEANSALKFRPTSLELRNLYYINGELMPKCIIARSETLSYRALSSGGVREGITHS